jgi:DNA (cytosine-5)-methyltransferase 1
MLHLGDITKISGWDAPIVDCVIGGSPCQDLSIAGKRAGLDGERSGLFMEQIRIVKEMRERYVRTFGGSNESIRPRYMVWENVPGAFSSNRGEDFQIVLEETAKVVDKNASIPMPDKGKWTTSGCILGDGWSIAWRVLDAQFYGVPQRRRRIALVADFGGHSAPEILFVTKGVSGDFDESQPKGKETSADASGSVGADGTESTAAYTLKIRGGCDGGGKGALIQTEKSATLSTLQDQTLFQPVERIVFSKHKRAQNPTDYETWQESDTANTLNTFDQGDVRTNECVVALDRASYNQGKNAQFDIGIDDKGIAQSLVAKGPGAVCYGIGAYHSNAWKSDNPNSGVYEADKSKTLDALNCGYPACNQGGMAVVAAVDCRNGSEDTVNGALQSNMAHSVNGNNIVRTRYIVRRLTPIECERLQGFPDGWTDIGEWTDSKGKVHKTSDAARYKALGNSIAIPPWKWVLKRLCACYERDATMASLFDGIGGFPYIWEQLNGKGTCLWASEIEEFPIAVTKARIGGD